MKKLLLATLVLAGGIAATQAGIHVSIGIGAPHRSVVIRPPVVVGPPPVVIAPPVCPPPRVIVPCPPVHYKPHPGHQHGRYDRHHDHRHHSGRPGHRR